MACTNVLIQFAPVSGNEKKFIQLYVLILGKMSPTNENIDVFIRPVVEELLQLWNGVVTQDFSKPPGERRFPLRGILIWVFSDYPAYGLISGLCIHGYKGCSVCGRVVTRTITDGRMMAAGSSMIWTHFSVRYEVTWGKTLAFTRTGSIHAMDAKGFGETT
jgi:hypothetical protein